jgi:hypothetical protein
MENINLHRNLGRKAGAIGGQAVGRGTSVSKIGFDMSH